MNRLEYSDLARFVTSAGVFLVAVGAALPWLVLREPFGLLVSRDVIASLSPVAREVFEQRQVRALFLIENIWFLSGFLVLVGGTGIFAGLRKWLPAQQALDKQNELAAMEADRKLAALKPDEVAAKAAEEAVIDRVVEASDSAAATEGDATVTTSVEAEPDRVNRLLASEKAFAAFLSAFAPEHYKLYQNQRFGPFTFDSALVPQTGGAPHLIFEVKDLGSRPSAGVIASARGQLERATDWYTRQTGAGTVPIVVVIVDDATVKPLSESPEFAIMKQWKSRAHVRVVPRTLLAAPTESLFRQIVRQGPTSVVILGESPLAG